ncbi:hypothetical protein DY000_02036386 [Brassica cretica]|uniref:Uncharacterized protein n=1 Tax=Brassica cretica TaxID=69181 RepID=A0ABQ7BK70_BRACR|nr:hypothetical protein DY000_02036386 [Brassica cretica]
MMPKLTVDLRAFESGLMGPPCRCSSGGLRLGWIVGSKPYLFSVLQVSHRRLLGSSLQVAASHPRILEDLKEFSQGLLVLGPSSVDSIFASLLRHPVSFLCRHRFVLFVLPLWLSSDFSGVAAKPRSCAVPWSVNYGFYGLLGKGPRSLCSIAIGLRAVDCQTSLFFGCSGCRLAFNPNKLGCIAFSINPASVSLLFTKLEVYGSAPVRLCYLFSFVVCNLLEFVLSPNFVSGWFSFTIRLLAPHPLRLCVS